MPRLRIIATGVVVNVSEETAARLGSGYEPVEAEKKRTAKKAAAPAK